MNTLAIQRFRKKLSSDKPVYGLWVTLESPAITEMAVALGLDWVVIDAEHSALDWQNIVQHIRATVRSTTVVMVRLVEKNIGLVKRALDIGADGVAAPFIETAEQLRQLVAFARYPPSGIRAVGGDRATVWGHCFAEHAAVANDHVLVLPNIETPKARANMDEMLKVEGVDTFFLGPADYSATAGHVGQWQGPGVAEQLLEIQQKVQASGKYCGVIATDNEDLLRRREQGFRIIALGVDTSFIMRGLKSGLSAVGISRRPNPSLSPEFDPGEE